jgi:hypothetical protein
MTEPDHVVEPLKKLLARTGASIHGSSNGSASLSVQPEGQRRREPLEIAWGSNTFSRGGRDVKPCCRTRTDSHTSSDSYGMSRPSLCTESEAEPNKMHPDIRLFAAGVGLIVMHRRATAPQRGADGAASFALRSLLGMLCYLRVATRLLPRAAPCSEMEDRYRRGGNFALKPS